MLKSLYGTLLLAVSMAIGSQSYGASEDDLVALARGIRVDVGFHNGYPPTVNHDEPVELVVATAERMGMRVMQMPSPVMGAEDFSYLLEKIPGAFAFIGARTEGGGPLHSDLMKLDESVLQKGAAFHVAVALTYLAQS